MSDRPKPTLSMRGHNCYGSMMEPVVEVEVTIDDSGNKVSVVVTTVEFQALLDQAVKEALAMY